MFSVSIITIAAVASFAECGYMYHSPGVHFQLSNQQHDNFQTYNSDVQTVNVNRQIYHDTVSYPTLNGQGFQMYQPFNNFAGYQNGLPHDVNNGLNLAQNDQYNNNAYTQPIVKKHIYFHVAPKDMYETQHASVTSNRKKIYKIIFIKVPSHNVNQGLPLNQYNINMEKTLIYVLSKNPKDDQQSLYKATKPNHEVYYVNYKGSSDRVTSQINNALPGVQFEV